MSLQLTICPSAFKGRESTYSLLAFTMRNNELNPIKLLDETRGRDVGKQGVWTHFADGKTEDDERIYGPTFETPYGKPIRNVLCGELVETMEKMNIQGWNDKAIYAYLKELPDDLEIWLYWH